MSTNATIGVSAARAPALRAAAGPELWRRRRSVAPRTPLSGRSRAVVDEHHSGRVEAVAEQAVDAGRRRLVGWNDDRDVVRREALALQGAEVRADRVDRSGVEQPLGEPRRRYRRRRWRSRRTLADQQPRGGTDAAASRRARSFRRHRRRRRRSASRRRAGSRAPVRRRSPVVASGCVALRVVPSPGLRASSTAVTRSSVKMSRRSRPSSSVASVGSPSTPLGLTPPTPPTRSSAAISASGRRSPGERALHIDQCGVDRQHQRRLGASGVGIAACQLVATRRARCGLRRESWRPPGRPLQRCHRAR